jgi:hypothetical protein
MNTGRLKEIMAHAEVLFKPEWSLLRDKHAKELRHAQFKALKTGNAAAFFPAEAACNVAHVKELVVAKANCIATAYTSFQEAAGAEADDDLLAFFATVVAARKASFADHARLVGVRTGRSTSQVPHLLQGFEREANVALLEGRRILDTQRVQMKNKQRNVERQSFYNANGPNARIIIDGKDNSSNVVLDGFIEQFQQIRPRQIEEQGGNMSPPWRELCKPEKIDIVAPDGSVRCHVVGYYGGTQFVIDDMKVDVRAGDQIRRMLPNGREEAFIVQDPKFYPAGPFGPHYQVKIGRGNVLSKQPGVNYDIHVSGSNSRVNIASTDQSLNTVVSGGVFNEIRRALEGQIQDEGAREQLKNLLSELEAARDQKSFISGYQAFIASAANHITIIAPFLPALTELLKNFSS